MQQQLFQAISECNERGLITSSIWASEQLYALQQSAPPPQNLGEHFSSSQRTPSKYHHLAQSFLVPFDAEYLYAKSLFDAREYHRASDLLKNRTDSKGSFLKLYSKLMVNYG